MKIINVFFPYFPGCVKATCLDNGMNTRLMKRDYTDFSERLMKRAEFNARLMKRSAAGSGDDVMETIPKRYDLRLMKRSI